MAASHGVFVYRGVVYGRLPANGTVRLGTTWRRADRVFFRDRFTSIVRDFDDNDGMERAANDALDRYRARSRKL